MKLIKRFEVFIEKRNLFDEDNIIEIAGGKTPDSTKIGELIKESRIK
ncbi:hypothetical protein H8D36_03305 [archaeon]|nr:hypothetical protein [archaeon]